MSALSRLPVDLPRHRFYMVRHGESLLNLTEKIGGDPTLSSFGTMQGFNVRNILQRAYPQPNKFFCSGMESDESKRMEPVLRTMETACMAGLREEDLIVVPGLRERAMGKFEGIITRRTLGGMTDREAEEAGIQSYPAHERQVMQALREQLEYCAEGDVPMFFVHHGTINRVINALGYPKQEIPNAGVIRFDPPARPGGEWHIAHLQWDGRRMQEIPVIPVQENGEVMRERKSGMGV